MNPSNCLELLVRLTGTALDQSVATVLSSCRHGFDVAVQGASREVLWVFENRLRSALRGGDSIQIQHLNVPPLGSRESSRTQGERTVLLTFGGPPIGLGFIPAELPSLEKCLPPFHKTIGMILEHWHQEMHEDLFDGPCVVRLKAVLDQAGLLALIDAVVRYAFFVGIHGDEASALRSLEVLQEPSVSPLFGETDELFPETNAEAFFRSALNQDKPHVFAKAALSCWVVHGLGCSVAEASRRLKVSRTTVQQHLRLACRHRVPALLGIPGRQKSNSNSPQNWA